MCLKFCVIVIFSYELWLDYFQYQRCSSPWNLFDDRLQTYLKQNLKCLWLQNILKYMFPWGTWASPWGSCFFPWCTFLTPCANCLSRYFICSLKNFLFFRDYILFHGNLHCSLINLFGIGIFLKIRQKSCFLKAINFLKLFKCFIFLLIYFIC
jgi:hypothetical protein